VEKFGVVVDEDRTKEASVDASPACPRCGERLLSWEKNNVPRCPKCGTAPFEAK